VYFEPESNEFKRIVTENLKKKYISTYKEKALDGDIAIEVLGKSKQSILKYKGFVFKGSTGRLKLKGPKELLQIAVDAGIGSRNSMGSGLIRIV
jgi:CRISPR-associated endoribonuclease Cas6